MGKHRATASRLREARRGGDSGHSGALTGGVVGVGALWVGMWCVGALWGALKGVLREGVSAGWVGGASLLRAREVGWGLAREVGEVLFLGLGGLCVLALLVGGVQTRFSLGRRPVALGGGERWSWRRVGPLLTRGVMSVVMCGVGLWGLYGERGALGGGVGRRGWYGEEVWWVVWSVGLCGVVYGLWEVWWVNFLRHRSLRMDDGELKRERRAQEGSPEGRGERRRREREASGARGVPLGVVVVVLLDGVGERCVMLGYAPPWMDPPHVGRGGVGEGCRVLLEEARGAGVPVVEAGVLARRLMREGREGYPAPAWSHGELSSVLAEHPGRLGRARVFAGRFAGSIGV